MYQAKKYKKHFWPNLVQHNRDLEDRFKCQQKTTPKNTSNKTRIKTRKNTQILWIKNFFKTNNSTK